MASKPANDSKGNQTLDECNHDALKAHNELRAKHGVPPVTLAKVTLQMYLPVMIDISNVLVFRPIDSFGLLSIPTQNTFG